MTNDELVKKIEELLKTDADLDFLLILKKKDLEKLGWPASGGGWTRWVKRDTVERGNERGPCRGECKEEDGSEASQCQSG